MEKIDISKEFLKLAAEKSEKNKKEMVFWDKVYPRFGKTTTTWDEKCFEATQKLRRETYIKWMKNGKV